MLVGTILRNRYKIIKQLGSGGFGDSYLATDTDLPGKPQCVVKHLKPKDPNPAILRIAERLFDREAEVLYTLGKEHDQIPNLLAHFEEKGQFYLVQELVDGHDLSQELIAGRRFSETEVVKLLQSILEVLAFVHQQNIIHRDIKPSNLMRRQNDGKIVLIDFGAVKEIRTLAVNTQGQVAPTIVIGSPGYMPNEQYNGHPNFYSDVYAVGVIGVQAITGVPPHLLQKDPRTQEIIWRNQAQVSDRLSNVLDKMVCYNCQHRYKSANQALEALVSSKLILRSVLIGLGGLVIGVVATAAVLNRLQPPITDTTTSPIASTPALPSLQPLSPSSSAVAETNFSDRVGLYAGKSLNKASYQAGKTVIEITEINTSTRKVRARAAWSEGLVGEGSLFGTINQDGIVELSGTLFYTDTKTQSNLVWDMDMRFEFFDQNTIKGTYRLYPRSGNPTGTQDAEFTVSKVNSN